MPSNHIMLMNHQPLSKHSFNLNFYIESFYSVLKICKVEDNKKIMCKVMEEYEIEAEQNKIKC